MAINASKPVSTAAVGAITYDRWAVTKLVGNIGLEKAPVIVTLTRAAVDADGKFVLMPNSDKDAETSFMVDVIKEAATSPEMKAALDAITSAIVAYGSKNGKL